MDIVPRLDITFNDNITLTNDAEKEYMCWVYAEAGALLVPLFLVCVALFL